MRPVIKAIAWVGLRLQDLDRAITTAKIELRHQMGDHEDVYVRGCPGCDDERRKKAA